jgi:hypothetical protein
MNALKTLLTISTVAIYTLTIIAIVAYGWNWPLIAINDLLALNWRSQFDFDFIIHLLLLASWVVWREGINARAYLFGLLCVVMGGMFSFPYIIYATYQASGKPRALLLGVHA